MAAQEFQSIPRAAAAERLGGPVQLPEASWAALASGARQPRGGHAARHGISPLQPRTAAHGPGWAGVSCGGVAMRPQQQRGDVGAPAPASEELHRRAPARTGGHDM